MVTLPGSVVSRYPRFSLYNSPYPAHDTGCAVDLYPETNDAPSPVAGEIIDTRTVSCPPKPYAGEHDHLILVDMGEYVARILHVDPGVEPGDRVEVGDSLGEMVRSGFFGQWVDNHIHLGVREPTQNAYRASGSLPLHLDVAVTGIPWDGTGTVVETGPTHVQLDGPEGSERGFVAIAADEGVPLDGGLPHYTGGGVLAPHEGPVSLLGTRVGAATGRDTTWNDVQVVANRTRATGLSLFASREKFGAKVVFHEGHTFEEGEEIEVVIREGERLVLG
ncbi:hypothetical protein [Natronomonas sp. EA1]|uniref:hypothetical protein n=1 Tax=Natronomonas sp. EA1 TaxID=3421655 RepID=UPI003EBCC30B